MLVLQVRLQRDSQPAQLGTDQCRRPSYINSHLLLLTMSPSTAAVCTLLHINNFTRKYAATKRIVLHCITPVIGDNQPCISLDKLCTQQRPKTEQFSKLVVPQC